MMDQVLNTPTGITTSVTVSVGNMIGNGLPFYINVITAIYLTLCAAHKFWKIYKEWKYGASSE